MIRPYFITGIAIVTSSLLLFFTIHPPIHIGAPFTYHDSPLHSNKSTRILLFPSRDYLCGISYLEPFHGNNDREHS